VFINRDDLDFATAADLPPTQSWELPENLDGRIELPTQVRMLGTETRGRRLLAALCSGDPCQTAASCMERLALQA